MRRYLRDPTFSSFDTIPENDRHTHTVSHTHTQTDRHTMAAYTTLSIASCGIKINKNRANKSKLLIIYAKIIHKHKSENFLEDLHADEHTVLIIIFEVFKEYQNLSLR